MTGSGAGDWPGQRFLDALRPRAPRLEQERRGYKEGISRAADSSDVNPFFAQKGRLERSRTRRPGSAFRAVKHGLFLSVFFVCT